MPPFPSASILAYPRIGRGRELKKALEARWADRISDAALLDAQAQLRKTNLARLVELGLGASDASLASGQSRSAFAAARASTCTSRWHAATRGWRRRK